jgi:hypothetical protein
MKPRVGVYLSEGMAARLAEAAKNPRATKSALVEAALDRFLGSDNDIVDTATVARHLAGLSRQLEELDRNLRIANETAALHARFHLAVTPLMPAGEQGAACELGAERFKEFATQVGRRVDLGVPLIRETIDRVSAAGTTPFTRAEGEPSGTGSTVCEPGGQASSKVDEVSESITAVRVDAARELFGLLAAVTAASAVMIYLIVPEAKPMASGAVSAGLRKVYADRRFWRLAPLSACCIGTAWALQGLWAAQWLKDVEGLDRAGVVFHLFAMAVALSLGAILLGVAADRLRRRGVGPEVLLGIVAAVFIATQFALILRLPLPSYLQWAVVAAVGAATVLSFAILAEYFPKELAGRANGALNLFHIAAAFVVQCATGVVLQHWTPQAGHYPEIAYQTAFALNLALQVAAWIWFMFPRVRNDSRQRLTPEPCSNLRPARR